VRLGLKQRRHLNARSERNNLKLKGNLP